MKAAPSEDAEAARTTVARKARKTVNGTTVDSKPVEEKAADRRTAARADLGAPVSRLPGAGPVTGARLAAAGIETVGDLLTLLPRAYDDLTRVTPMRALKELSPGTTVLVRGRIAAVRSFPGRFLTVTVEDEHDDGQRVVGRWFRAPGGMSRAYVKGEQVALAGPLRFDPRGEPELVHPTNVTAALRDGSGLGIRPRYPAVDGVAARALEKVIGHAVERSATEWPDVLPEAARRRLDLPSAAEALRELHRPPDTTAPDVLLRLAAGKSPAHRRLALDDLLVVQAMLAERRQVARSQPGRACAADPAAVRQRLEAALPFALTGAQRRAIAEIQADMAASHPMQRLLVGDVGSGKTLVALAAAVQAAASGGQALLMAPTEVLAEQHARVIGPLAEKLEMRVGLLTASTPRPQRESLLALAAAGKVAVLVGTHALLAERVMLPDVRLAIVDEQHRFGVSQRARLGRNETVPHLLVMSATPIPRTLAFTVWGDLDLSILDERPPGRAPVRTELLVGDVARRRASEALRETIAAGQRAFVVCPVRSESAREDGVTAVARHRELTAELAPAGARVGLVHGELDAAAKDGALRAFDRGDLDVLVATTVIEVGIDVPAATLMIIEEADRFGLAQLHQLRGRVGRGNQPGRCLLLAARHAPEESIARLKVVAGTQDGFKIAEADLELRGCGDLFGSRQAGAPRLRVGGLADYAELVGLARQEAAAILAADPHLAAPEHRALREAVERRAQRGTAVYAEDAG